MSIIACSSSSARMKITTAGDLLTLSARWWGKQKIDNFLALRARSRTSRTVEFSRKNREKRQWTSYVHSSPVQVCKCVRICSFAFFIREKVMWLKSWSQVGVRLFDCITKWWLTVASSRCYLCFSKTRNESRCPTKWTKRVCWKAA